jgi:hypothetical protein
MLSPRFENLIMHEDTVPSRRMASQAKKIINQSLTRQSAEQIRELT